MITKGLLLVSCYPSTSDERWSGEPALTEHSRGAATNTQEGKGKGGIVNTTPYIRPGLSPAGGFSKDLNSHFLPYSPCLRSSNRGRIPAETEDGKQRAMSRQDPGFRLICSLL